MKIAEIKKLLSSSEVKLIKQLLDCHCDLNKDLTSVLNSRNLDDFKTKLEFSKKTAASMIVINDNLTNYLNNRNLNNLLTELLQLMKRIEMRLSTEAKARSL